MSFSPVERQTYTLTVGETLELTDAIRARASTLEMVGRCEQAAELRRLAIRLLAPWGLKS